MGRTSITAGACLVLVGACASARYSPSADDDDADGGLDVDAGDDVDIDAATSMPPDPPPVHTLDDLTFRCKLISERNVDDPTTNNTHYRANLRGTDLGIPVAHGNDLYFFFGDSAGDQQIWPLGPESLPDAVGYSAAGAAQVATNPSILCSQLRFLRVNGASGSVEADFAGAWMTPPSGHAITQYVHNPAGPRGANAFPNMPGDFEVPTGAFSYGGSIYLYYSIVQVSPLEMRGSYLAEWRAPSTTGLPTYDIVHHVDQRFDGNGALRGDFINIAPLVVGEYVYLYGTGPYRTSPVHLARKRLTALETAGGYERYNAATGAWVPPATANTAPIVPVPAIGELSVRYFPNIGRYVMLDQEVTLGNRIAARFARSPEGPWSEPVTVANMNDSGFVAQYCCNGTDCPGERMMECEHAAFYAPHMLPNAIAHPDGSFSITFLVSTHIPYNVALLTATFR
jgi:hypothetical protein